MGNLHAGHLKLVEQARQCCDHVITSIFVNPMQFGHNEDLDAYPRTLEADAAALASAGCDELFAPSPAEIYPQQSLTAHTVVSVPGLTARHCGASRPGHFDGVSTVVCKLFNIVRPDVAVFGLKDYQQYLIICKMVEDLCFQLKIRGVETQRESSGLALSSRNSYLSATQREQASKLYQLLQHTRDAIQAGSDTFSDLERRAFQHLQQADFKPDYFAICNAQTLLPPSPDDHDLVILLAAYLGTTRLIDNIRFQR
jgi:pantoate--beta-alanine ligase